MIVIPAIDLRDNCCVRLAQGDPHRQTVYSKEPVSVAKLWRLKGATWIHVVDLDGAFTGKPKHLAVVKQIVKETRVSVEFGGGVRSMETIEELIDAGVRRVILGTLAVDESRLVEKAVARYGDRIAVALDVRRGKIATRGWKHLSAKSALEVAGEMQKLGVKTFIFTEVSRDGMLRGPAFKATLELVKGIGARVIASGGITQLKHLVQLRKLEKYGVFAAIVGKALYSGRMDLKQAIAAAKKKRS